MSRGAPARSAARPAAAVALGNREDIAKGQGHIAGEGVLSGVMASVA